MQPLGKSNVKVMEGTKSQQCEGHQCEGHKSNVFSRAELLAIIVHDPPQIASNVKVMEGTESQQLPMNAVCGSSPDAYWCIASGPPST